MGLFGRKPRRGRHAAPEHDYVADVPEELDEGEMLFIEGPFDIADAPESVAPRPPKQEKEPAKEKK